MGLKVPEYWGVTTSFSVTSLLFGQATMNLGLTTFLVHTGHIQECSGTTSNNGISCYDFLHAGFRHNPRLGFGRLPTRVPSKPFLSLDFQIQTKTTQCFKIRVRIKFYCIGYIVIQATQKSCILFSSISSISLNNESFSKLSMYSPMLIFPCFNSTILLYVMIVYRDETQTIQLGGRIVVLCKMTQLNKIN